MKDEERQAVQEIVADAIGCMISDDGCSTLAYDGGSFKGTTNMTDEELIEEMESYNLTIEECVKQYADNRPTKVEIDIDRIPEALRHLVK